MVWLRYHKDKPVRALNGKKFIDLTSSRGEIPFTESNHKHLPACPLSRARLKEIRAWAG